MGDTLAVVARLDGDDAQDVAAGMTQVRELLAFCRGHLEHEGDFVHAAMEARSPGSTAATALDHDHHIWAIDKLASLCNEIERSGAAVRHSLIVQLHRYLAVFVGENLVHMNAEETDNNAVLWATHSDEELLGIEHAIVASLQPAEQQLTMRWMIPALNANERAKLFMGMRRQAPAPVFEAVLSMAEQLLSARDSVKLRQALSMPAVLAA
jgi:hypothetical protein